MRSLIIKLLGRERRKFKRYIVSEATPIFLNQDPPQEAIIRDLSLGGISITCSDCKGSVGEMFYLDIRAGNGFHLGKIGVETVAEKKEGDKKFRDGNYRRIRGSFVGMSKVQRLKLKVFLENFEHKIRDKK
jgi:PilZ domain